MEHEEISNAALLRMRKALNSGHGVRLTWDELSAFSVEVLGDWWNSIDDDGKNMEASGYMDTPLR